MIETAKFQKDSFNELQNDDSKLTDYKDDIMRVCSVMLHRNSHLIIFPPRKLLVINLKYILKLKNYDIKIYKFQSLSFATKEDFGNPFIWRFDTKKNVRKNFKHDDIYKRIRGFIRNRLYFWN